MSSSDRTNSLAQPLAGLGLLLSLGCLAFVGSASAGALVVPNFSFESPVTPYANPPVDSWQKTPKPAWYIENGGFYWEQLVGNFKNPAPGYPDRIDNCHGLQAAWVFAVPEVGFFQDYDSQDWNDPAPTHAFDVTIQPGKFYRLTVGVAGGGGGMLVGVPLELSLYYRDASSNQVPIAARVITNDPALFPSNTHLVDFAVQTPVVRGGDPWAGRKLGIRVLSLVSQETQGGYWDVDNVRLAETMVPELSNPARPAPGQFQFTLRTDPGQICEILSAPGPSAPRSVWTSFGTLTNHTGLTNLVVPAPGSAARFYQARALP